MKDINVPWVDKYRPLKLSQIIQQTDIIKILKKMIENNTIPHLLFYGPPGTGKTSTIYALALELFGIDNIDERVLELNASDERGIGIVRNKITKFVKSSINKSKNLPPIKIIIMDEADAMTREAQSALRKLMETTDNTRFCFICNYKHQIIEPIESRCACFRFKSINNNLLKETIKKIALNEKMIISDEICSFVSKLSEGDGRKGIMLLHNLKYIYNANNKLLLEDVKNITGYFDNFMDIKKLKDMTIPEINKETLKIINEGYPINNVLNYLIEVIINSDIDDKTKSIIILYISNIETILIEKGTEYIQLLSILVYIKSNI